jgi:hypothetical protein
LNRNNNREGYNLTFEGRERENEYVGTKRRKKQIKPVERVRQQGKRSVKKMEVQK